jgi:hypothetical protein
VGEGELRERLLERAEARRELFGLLLEWAGCYRLSDANGERNPWLLQHALNVLSVKNVLSDDEWRWAELWTPVEGAAQKATGFRSRKHSKPRRKRKDGKPHLGPLARDFRLLAYYVCSNRPVPADLRAGLSHPTVAQQVVAAAARAGFDLPHPLRYPR